MTIVMGREQLGVSGLLARGRRGVTRYGWMGLSNELVMRSVRPALAPVAARRLRDRAETVSTVDEILNFMFEFDAFGIRIQPFQSRWELQRLLEEVHRLRPQAMLEIGTANGGSLFGLARVCAPNAHIISVDLPKGDFGGGYPRWKTPLFKSFACGDQRLDLMRADSHDRRTFNEVQTRLNGQMLDFVFIDGDHAYDGVRRDLVYELYLSWWNHRISRHRSPRRRPFFTRRRSRRSPAVLDAPDRDPRGQGVDRSTESRRPRHWLDLRLAVVGNDRDLRSRLP